MPLLNQWNPRILWKSCKQFRVKTSIFGKFIQFSSKEVSSLHTLPMWLNARRLRPLNPSVPLLVARGAKTVNDQPAKVLNLSFLTYFSWKWAQTFEKQQVFTFGPKQCVYLTHSTLEYFKKFAFKKNPKKHNFEQLHLKSLEEFRVKTNIFRKFIQFSSEQCGLIHPLGSSVDHRGFRPL